CYYPDRRSNRGGHDRPRLFQALVNDRTFLSGQMTVPSCSGVFWRLPWAAPARRMVVMTAEVSPTGSDADPLVHILWMNGGLGCDGDSVALTAATQPSIEEIALGALPGLPRVAVHWPLIDFECGPETGADNFIEWWHKADRGELDPFVLV